MAELEKADTSEDDRAVALMAIDEIKRIESLLKSILNFARPPKSQPMIVRINDILNKSIAFSLRHPSLQSKYSHTIKILKDFDKNLPVITADPFQLRQVFLNLLLNAIDAMQDGGVLAVKTSYDAAVNSIRINISDSGRGTIFYISLR